MTNSRLRCKGCGTYISADTALRMGLSSYCNSDCVKPAFKVRAAEGRNGGAMIPGAAKEGARIAKAAKAKAAKAKRPKEDPGLTAARNVVRARSHGLCEFQIPLVCTYQGVLAHHRLRRSHTTGHDPQTMVWICSKCHEYTHANPQLAYEKGWMIRS